MFLTILRRVKKSNKNILIKIFFATIGVLSKHCCYTWRPPLPHSIKKVFSATAKNFHFLSEVRGLEKALQQE